MLSGHQLGAGAEAGFEFGVAVAEWVVAAVAEVDSLKSVEAADGPLTIDVAGTIGGTDVDGTVASIDEGTGVNTADIDGGDGGDFGDNPGGADTVGVAGVLHGTSAELCHLP